MSVFSVAVVAIILVVTLVLLSQSSVFARTTRKKSAAALQKELYSLAHDREVAARLLARMERLHPDASEARRLQLAIKELRRDRRR